MVGDSTMESVPSSSSLEREDPNGTTTESSPVEREEPDNTTTESWPLGGEDADDSTTTGLLVVEIEDTDNTTTTQSSYGEREDADNDNTAPELLSVDREDPGTTTESSTTSESERDYFSDLGERDDPGTTKSLVERDFLVEIEDADYTATELLSVERDDPVEREDPDRTRKLIKIKEVFADKNSLRHRRNRFESISTPLHYIYSDPPWIDKQLAFTVCDKKQKINELVCNIRVGFDKCHVKKKPIQKIEQYIKDLGEMISTDPRLGDLLEMDFLKLIVRFLESQQSPRLQAYVAVILTTVVPFYHNKDDVGVVIKSITPLVLNLICSDEDLVRLKALWLLRSLVFKFSKSDVEEVLPHVTSIILEDYIVFGVLRPAAEVLLVVCQEHPKLSSEKLMLVLPALMKLIQSDVLLLLTSGCWGLAQLCDGREEMIVEDKDLKSLIRRLVNIMNWEYRAPIIAGLISLGSLARWGSDLVIEALMQDKGSLNILSILLDEGDMYIVKQVCWIISNITARKREHILTALEIDGQLLKRLVKIVQTSTLADVVKEALWALSNAMCGVPSGSDLALWFLHNCYDIYWVKRLIPFESDTRFVLVFLEGMVNIGAAQVFQAGFRIDRVRLHHFFKNIVRWRGLFTGIRYPDDFTQSSCGVELSDVGGVPVKFIFRGLPNLVMLDDSGVLHHHMIVT